MKTCEDWDCYETLWAICPYCKHEYEESDWMPSDKYIEECPNCNKQFLLGHE